MSGQWELALEQNPGKRLTKHFYSTQRRYAESFAVESLLESDEGTPVGLPVLRPVLECQLHSNLDRSRPVVAVEDVLESRRSHGADFLREF